MKKAIVFALCAINFSVLAEDPKKITRTTSRGGADGYESTKYTDDGSSITIECSNPGFESCPAVPSNNLSSAGERFALDKIAAGVLSGNQTINVSGVVLMVTWKSSNSRATDSFITVTPI